MSERPGDPIRLVLDWHALGQSAGLRRNTAGFADVKLLAESSSRENPLVINAFLYAFLCPAKNFDLFLQEDVEVISTDLARIEAKMKSLEAFEREASALPDRDLRRVYLAARKFAARKSALDERRVLATLLFSGPSTATQIVQDLGMSENLAVRILRVLDPVAEEQDQCVFAIRSDTDTLAVVLQLLQSTLGLDPVRVLRRRIDARNAEALP